jgi:CRP-like cAMP-binding protein
MEQQYADPLSVGSRLNRHALFRLKDGMRMLDNYVIGALPPEEVAALAPHLKLISVRAGEGLGASSTTAQLVYFPTTAILSIHQGLENGAAPEVASVGREGFFGLSLFMDHLASPARVLVQTAGHCYCVEAGRVEAAVRRAGAMQSAVLRYLQTLFTQVAQLAACNAHHAIHRRLCRWLLLTLDRMPSSEIVVTHQAVASALGVGREGVTTAASHLRKAGAVDCRRGRIIVLDRSQMEADVCECYGIVKQLLIRLRSDAPVRRVVHADPYRFSSERPMRAASVAAPRAARPFIA